MSSEIALDTSVVIEIFGNDPTVKERLRNVETVWMPVPVIAEIAVGFTDSGPLPSQQSEFDVFLTSMKVIDCSREVAVRYGEIHRFLRRKGAMIPVNDIWIAACCVSAAKPLATRDAHFSRIPELTVEMW